MRVRTLVAGITLAMFTTVLGAPAALAAQPDPPPVQPDDKDKDKNKDDNVVAPDPNANLNANQPAQIQPVAVPPKATVSVSPDAVEKGQTFGINGTCTEGGTPTLSASGADLSGTTGTVTAEAGETVTVKLKCTNSAGEDEAEDSFKVLASPAAAQQKQAAIGPLAFSVNPDERFPGEGFDIDYACPTAGPPAETVTASPAGAVEIDGDLDGGKVKLGALPGTVTFTLTCPGGETTQDSLTVKGRNAFLDLDPNDGFRDDKVEAEAYCPGSDDADLRSDVLDDVELKRDGDGILRGRTRVKDDAEYGDSEAVVVCRNSGDRPKDDFYVLQHRKADLDLDPAFGKRGDEIKVYVICDFTVGKLESDVLDDIEVKHDDDDAKWRYRGKTKVVSDAKEGEHTVKIKCGDDYLEEEFFVIVDGDAKGGTQVTVYPKGAPQTGGGPVGSGPGAALGLAGLTGFATLPARRTVRR